MINGNRLGKQVSDTLELAGKRKSAAGAIPFAPEAPCGTEWDEAAAKSEASDGWTWTYRPTPVK